MIQIIFHTFNIIESFFIGGDSAIFAHGIRPGVIGRQRVIQVEIERVEHSPQVQRSAVDRLRRVEGVADAHFPGGFRHELHQPLGTFAGNHRRVEIAFHLDDRFDQCRIQLIFLGTVIDQAVKPVFIAFIAVKTEFVGRRHVREMHAPLLVDIPVDTGLRRNAADDPKN